MIPIKLTLKNFMSYGADEEVLSFEGMHVACLSGDNGNGKSALLDAITWALWGRTRASRTTVEDDLIRLGADEVEVRFEFELNQQHYRVVKRRRRSKTSDCQLTQQDSSGAYKAIGGSSQRETGRQIVQLLNMEYETFLNSAYLQQGRADEFARQTPDNRKRILGEILGLDKFEKLEAKSKERYKQQKEIVDEIAGEIRLLEAEIARLPGYEVELEQTQGEITLLETQVHAQQQTVQRLRDRRVRLDTVAQQLDEASAAVNQATKEAVELDQELCKKIVRVRQIRETLDQRNAIEKDWERLQQCRVRREKLDPEIEAFNKTNTELRTVQGAIDTERERLSGDVRVLKSELTGMEQRKRESEELVREIRALELTVLQTGDLESALQAADAELSRIQEEFSGLRSKNERLKTDLADIEEVLALLARPQSVCPVCSGDLSGSKKEAVLARQQAKRDSYLEEMETLKREGQERKQELQCVQEKVTALRAQSDQGQRVHSRLQVLQERKHALEKQGMDLEGHQKRIQEMENSLMTESYAAPKRLHRKRLEQELERLALAKTEHEAVTRTIQSLEGAEKRFEKLVYADENIEREEAEQERLEKALKARRMEIQTQERRVAELSRQLADYDTLKSQLEQAEAEQSRGQREMNALRIREGAALNAIEGCRRDAERRSQRAAEMKRADQEKWIYYQLMSAFGRKGVQALIIENAVPEIETEANDLLARMTDNALQVHFETTKTAKSSGNEAETLEIKITDDAGTRPYELFSGGEAFRVNFAIRIALSRLLARRSGARLQTLILDEGFGTQDGKGREKLVEVIESIKDDFEKILVITHVDELKDSFNQRVEITKDGSGSHIHVL